MGIKDSIWGNFILEFGKGGNVSCDIAPIFVFPQDLFNQNSILIEEWPGEVEWL